MSEQAWTRDMLVVQEFARWLAAEGIAAPAASRDEEWDLDYDLAIRLLDRLFPALFPFAVVR